MLILSAIFLSASAQKADWYFSVTEATARQLSDSIAYSATGTFVFKGLLKLSNLPTSYTFRYVETGTEADPDPHYIDVWFNKIGSNFDFVRVTARFSDVFPFYKKFIDSTADSLQTLKMYSNAKVIPWTAERNVRCHLGKDQGVWTLKVHTQSVQPVFKSGNLNGSQSTGAHR